MKINLDFYKEKQEELLPIDEEIIEIIKQNNKEEYENIIKKDTRLEIVYALSEIRENILNWYEFKEDATILELKPNFGEITGLLCKNASKVISIESSLKKAQAIQERHKEKENLEVIVGEIENIKLSDKFDYVVITDIFAYAPKYVKGENPFEELIKYAVSMLNPNGKILFATDNKFGIQYWNGKRDLDNTKEYREITRKRKINECQLFGERQIRELLNDLQLKYKLYYMFPNYKMPNLIYDEDHNMSKEDISRNFTCHIQDQIINFNENQALDRIVKEDKKIFNFFVNSFFIEISKEQIENDIKYVTFTNYRKKQYRIVTIIKENEVIKKPANQLSKEHISNMVKNFEYLKQYDVNVLEKEQNKQIASEYIKDYQRLDLKLENTKSIEELEKEFTTYVEVLYKNSISYEEVELDEVNEFVKKYDINKLNKMKFLKYCFTDLIPKNCFDIEGKLGVFDQEWMEKYLPVEYVIYRAIKNSNIVDGFLEKLYENYNLLDYEDLFIQLEEEFRDRVMDHTMLYDIFNRRVPTEAEILEELQNVRSLNAMAQNEISKKQKEIQELTQQIVSMVNSRSWKITQPLRTILQAKRDKKLEK